MKKNTNNRPSPSRERFKLGIVSLPVAPAISVPIRFIPRRLWSDDICPVILEHHSNSMNHRSGELALTVQPLLPSPVDETPSPSPETVAVENVF